MEIPYFKQSKPTSCGAACLKMVLSSFGFNIGEEDIWNACKSSRPGSNEEFITIDNLAKYTQQQGFLVLTGGIDINNDQQIKSLFKNIFSNKIPLIVRRAWRTNKESNHYVTVFKYKKNNVYFHDPENNLSDQKESFIEFKEKWTMPNYSFSGLFIVIFPKDKDFNIRNIELLKYKFFVLDGYEYAERKKGKYQEIGWIKKIAKVT